MSNTFYDIITVYTDGSCINNGKPNAKCGYGVYFPNEELPNISKPFVLQPLTNQRSELYAIYKALKKITKKLSFNKVNVYSDSEYSIKCLTVWIKNWKKNNWKTSNNKPVSNQDIIIKIDEILSKHPNKISFIHVRSHTGKTDIHSIGNDKADKLAETGRMLN